MRDDSDLIRSQLIVLPGGVSLLLILTAGQTTGLTHFPPLSPQYSQDSQGDKRPVQTPSQSPALLELMEDVGWRLMLA